MKTTLTVLLLVIALLFVGCLSSKNNSGVSPLKSEPTSGSNYNSNQERTGASKLPASEQKSADVQNDASKPQQQVSQDQTDNSQSNNTAIERKIIKNAELVFEVSAPDEYQRKISSIAESKGGYVVSSDSTQQGGTESRPPSKLVKIVLRIPSAQFDAVLNDIKASGVGTAKQEKITGLDVTEEFIDVEARIKTLKATEAQMMEIMKRANTINELLNVQQKLGELRSQIESLEGRLRYLQNQTSLSTITVTLQQPGTYIVSPTGFFYRLKNAIADGLDAAAEVVLFLVRAMLALLPLGLIVAVPAFFLIRYFKRRKRNEVLVQKLEEDAKQE